MAKLSKTNLAILGSVIAASASDPSPFIYVSEADAKNLVVAGLVEQNAAMKDANGALATRATDAGRAYGQPANEAGGEAPAGDGSAPAADVARTFTRTKIAAAALPPAPERKSRVGVAVYPFADLEAPDGANFDGFFVPATAKMPHPAKALASTISSAEKRFATETGTKTVTRAKRGKGRGAKAEVDPATGKPIMETVTLPTYAKQREFAVRHVEDGTAYGSPGVKGAFIYRTK